MKKETKKKTKWAVMRTDAHHPVAVCDTLDAAVARVAKIVRMDAPHSAAFDARFGHYVVEVAS